MQNLQALASSGQPEHYKRNLPIPFVLEEHGHYLTAKGDKLACPCPFHEDSDPSFDVWITPEGFGRWSCFPCADSGDVLDLLGKLDGLTSFGDRMAEAERVLASMPADYVPPVAEARKAVGWDAEAAAEAVDTASLYPTPVYEFLDAKGLALDPEFLRDEFEVGGTPSGEIVIPFYDRERSLVAYKHRTASTKAISAPGSQLKAVLYGEWRDKNPSLPVVLCEGESDTWRAQAELGRDYICLGLSTGSAQRPRTQNLAGRRIFLAFDGDDAGRKATQLWAPALLSEGCDVQFVPVPEGADLCTVPSVRALLEQTRRLMPAPDLLKEHGDTYVRPGKDTNTMLSNWRFEPSMELVAADGMTAYEGMLLPAGRRVTLSSADLSSKARIVSWCTRYGASWLGSDRDAQALLALLQHKGPFLPSGRLVQTAGLHESAFVWPNGRAGRSNLVYTAPQYDIHLGDRLFLERGDWTALQITSLRALHRRDVMDPILGWLAAAPLRSLLPSFPTLAVTGSSGSGKTTLLSTVLAAFSGADISTNLTSTTRHALSAFLASVNAFPVWFDEYRPGARKDTQMMLEQLIRDAYTGQISAKGGLGEHWSEVSAMRTDAPIIVSGEDTFTETSHTERMVNLPLPSKGRNPDALRGVVAWGRTGLPRAYLEWLADRLAREDIYLVPSPAGAESLPPRQRDNLGTVRFGWNLLQEFCLRNNLVLDDPDLSLVEEAGTEASRHNPIKDALRWAMQEPEAYNFAIHDPNEGRIYVRVINFVNFIDRAGGFQLPGRAAAVERYLLDNYDGHKTQHPFSGARRDCLSISDAL